jgi:hypothetical protein
MTVSPAVTGLVPTPVQATPLVPNASSANSGLSFGDILDAVNPLEHIPVLSSLYRAATGSQISAGARVVGDTLYGALLPGGAIAGFASSLADVAVKQVTGKDIGQYVVGAVTPSPSAPAATTPLTPTAALPASTTPAQTPIAPVPLSSHAAHSPSNQYQRIQALDAINKKLVKIKV